MSSVNRPITKAGGVPVSPLLIYQPFNIIVFLSFYSPIILAMCMIYLSFISQNFKGFIYLGFLIGVCVVRNFVYMLNGAKTETNDGSICTSIQYSAYGNPTFSAFVFAFTIMYLSLPMFSNGAPNFWVFFGLVVYFFIDIFIKIYKKCVIQTTDLVLNILLGLVSSAIIVSLMYAGGSGKYLFFNEVSSTKEICSQPKKQTFKCQVFKDGTLVGNI
jgi:hypothetical protein